MVQTITKKDLLRFMDGALEHSFGGTKAVLTVVKSRIEMLETKTDVSVEVGEEHFGTRSVTINIPKTKMPQYLENSYSFHHADVYDDGDHFSVMLFFDKPGKGR